MQSLFRTAFDSKFAGWICVLLAILNKMVIAWLYTSLVGDKSLFLLFTKTFLQTGVLAEPVQTMEDGMAMYFYNPAVTSPLYSLLCVPLLWITKSYVVTQFIVTLLGWTLLFVALYKVTLLLFKERWIAHLFILCTGFFLYPHEFSSVPKDMLAVAFTLWSVYFSYRFIEKQPNLLITTLLALSIACVCLIKLLYVPIGAVVFLLLLFFIRKKGKQHLFHFFLLTALLLAISCAFYFLLFQPARQLAVSMPVALPNDGTVVVHGFYPQNLAYTYPFISASFFNTNFWGVQLENLKLLSYSTTVRLFQWLNLITVPILSVAVYRYRYTLQKRLPLLIASVSVIMIVIVCFLSLREKAFAYKSSLNLWTWVTDARSFLVPMLALQMLLFLFVFKKSMASLLAKIIFLIFFFECLHGVYFLAKQTTNANAIIASNNRNSGVKNLIRLIEEKKVGDSTVSLITSDNTLRRFALMKGVMVYAFSNKPADLSWMKKGSTFFVATHAVDSIYLKKFPAGSLLPMDTIPPYVLHRFTAN